MQMIAWGLQRMCQQGGAGETRLGERCPRHIQQSKSVPAVHPLLSSKLGEPSEG